MCTLGDIIVIDEYLGEDNKKINTHSFIVINDKPGFIEGLRYDFVTNVMSSFKSKEHRTQKLRFEENLEIISDNITSYIPANNKNGFIKADQLIYFNKKKIKYYVLGRINEELLDELVFLIIHLSKNDRLKNNIKNL